MNNTIRLHATRYNVSFQFQRAPNPLILPHHLHHHTKISPRLFTTTTIRKQPTQTPPRNLDVFLPNENARPRSPLNNLIQTSVTPPTLPILKPVTTHHDLTSYLTFQHHRLLSAPTAEARQQLNTSSVHLGTRYEYLIQSNLQKHLGFTLTRIGGRGDGGVDLIGSWTLPTPLSSSSSSKPSNHGNSNSESTPSFRILLQAKRIASHRNPMPALMRELDGTILSSSTSRWISAAFAMHGVRTAALVPTQSQFPDDNPQTPHNSNTSISDLSHLPTLGILVTTRPLTSGIEKAMASSRRCLMYVCLEEVEDSEVQDVAADELSLALSVPSTKIRQMAWNAAASRAGLEGYDVVTKYGNNDDGVLAMNGEVIMMFQGQPVGPP